jgi:hypothetical protein
MTPIERVFMLEANTKLTFDTMLEIYKSGFTRIPVYDGSVSKDRFISVLYVKDLILVDPDDEIEVQTVVSFRCSILLPLERTAPRASALGCRSSELSPQRCPGEHTPHLGSSSCIDACMQGTVTSALHLGPDTPERGVQDLQSLLLAPHDRHRVLQSRNRRAADSARGYRALQGQGLCRPLSPGGVHA